MCIRDRVVLALALTTFGLIGCSSNDATKESSETRVVETAKGEVEIPANPCLLYTSVLDNFEEIGDLGIDDDSYILIITRGHLYDYNVLEWSLKTNAYYIGMIGSATKIEMSYDKLKKEGFTQKDIDRVHAPIGIKLAAKTPAEIAVSIAGQLINCLLYTSRCV